MKNILTLYLSLFLCIVVYGQNILAEHHFESADIQEVSVIGTFCDVYVTKGDKVIFDGIIEGRGEKDDYLIASIKSGNSVVFKVEKKREYKGWNWQNIQKARFDITIPDNVALRIDNSSGDVKVDGISGREYRIETTSGDIYLKEMAGELYAKSTSGDVTIISLSGNIIMQSTSGDQEYRNVVGNLETRATSGDVDVRGLKGNLSIRSTSGDLEIDQVEGAISLGTTSGNIRSSRVLLTDDSNARATSGDIYIDFLNDLEDIGFDLKATSGDMKVGSIDGEDKLVLRRGNILFEGNTTSGDQVYRD